MPKPNLAAHFIAPFAAIGLACLAGCQTEPEEDSPSFVGDMIVLQSGPEKEVYSFEGDMIVLDTCQLVNSREPTAVLESIHPAPADTFTLNDTLRICFSGSISTHSPTYYGYSGPVELATFNGLGSGTYVEMSGRFSDATHCLSLTFYPNASPNLLDPGVYATRLTLNRNDLVGPGGAPISFGEFADDGQSVEEFFYFLRIE